VSDDGVKGQLMHTLVDQRGRIMDICTMPIPPLTFDIKSSSGSLNSWRQRWLS